MLHAVLIILLKMDALRSSLIYMGEKSLYRRASEKTLSAYYINCHTPPKNVPYMVILTGLAIIKP